MRLVGPDRYRLYFNSRRFTVRGPNGDSKFRGRAAARRPKLYVVSRNRRPFYVGIAVQGMRGRLRLGWKANLKTGYRGYAWRRHYSDAALHIWYLEPAQGASGRREIETIEAEVVFGLRRAKRQWPRHQTEIHFHPSSTEHRKLAANVLRHFDIAPS